MRLLINTIVLLACSYHVNAHDVPKTKFLSREGGKTVEVVVDEKSFEKLKGWDMRQQLTLPIDKAIVLAEKYVKSKSPLSYKYTIKYASLVRYKDTKHWYYKIKFERDDLVLRGYMSPTVIIILLDGTIVNKGAQPVRNARLGYEPEKKTK